MSDKIAVGFSNCLGNFVLMLPAIKILRKRHKKAKIDMITDSFMWDKRKSVQLLAEYFFDAVKVDHDGGGYDEVFYGSWSQPECLLKADDRRSISWIRGGSHSGVHEAFTYLDMIGASFNDFDGYPSIPLPECVTLYSKNAVALANSSDKRGSGRGSKTKWNKFPELSKRLVDAGFDVILVGQDDELEGCEGHNFVGKLSILGTMAVLNQCKLLVCPDMGLMHVADMLGVPVLLLAGPTPVTKSAPLVSKYEVVRNFHACAPCFQSGFWAACKDHECMSSISVDQVLEKIFRMVPFEIPKVEFMESVVVMSQFVSLFSYKNCSKEIVYDASEDRIGDLFGAMFLLKKMKEQKPDLKISWYNATRNKRDNSEWFDGFDVLSWIDPGIENKYDKIPRGCRVISSRRDFSVWKDLKTIGMSEKWYPKMDKKSRPKGIELPKEYVALHILRRTVIGERSTNYVGRREMSIKKYEKLCEMLLEAGFFVVRIGHKSDNGHRISGIVDLSDEGLSLEDSLRIVVNSKLFIGGDTGHKLVASACGVPCIIEIDKFSYAAGGLGGCNPNLVTSFNLGVNVDILFQKALEILCKK